MMPETSSSSECTIDQSAVDEFLVAFADAYRDDLEAYVASFRGDATFFLSSSEGRIDGAREYRRLLHARGLSAKERSMTIEAPELRTFANVAVATYQSRLEVDGHSVRTRVTLVLTPDAMTGALRIAHLHSSPLEGPAVAAVRKSVDQIALIEERVATAIAATGTPK